MTDKNQHLVGLKFLADNSPKKFNYLEEAGFFRKSKEDARTEAESLYPCGITRSK